MALPAAAAYAAVALLCGTAAPASGRAVSVAVAADADDDRVTQLPAIDGEHGQTGGYSSSELAEISTDPLPFEATSYSEMPLTQEQAGLIYTPRYTAPNRTGVGTEGAGPRAGYGYGSGQGSGYGYGGAPVQGPPSVVVDCTVRSIGFMPIPSLKGVPLPPTEATSAPGANTSDSYAPPFLNATLAPNAPEHFFLPIAPWASFLGGRPEAVVGPDDRKVYKDTNFPWSTIGRIDTPSGQCTGTMVARNLMVTASHCIPWDPDLGFSWLRFSPAYSDGQTPFGSAMGTHVLYIYQHEAGKGIVDSEAAFDYAVVVLAEPIGDLTGWMGYTTYKAEWDGKKLWWNAGYPAGTNGQIPMKTEWQEILSVKEFQRDGYTGYVLGHLIDTEPGQSGSPIFGVFGESEIRLVGIHSHGASIVPCPFDENHPSCDNGAAGGPGLTTLINDSREQFPLDSPDPPSTT